MKIFSREDFALKSKLRPAKFLQHLPIFAGNSRFTGVSQLRAGKTGSKGPRSHCLSTGHLLPYMWASFHPLELTRYLCSFSRWRPKSKNIQFFTIFHFNLVKKKRRPAAYSILKLSTPSETLSYPVSHSTFTVLRQTNVMNIRLLTGGPNWDFKCLDSNCFALLRLH